MIRIRRFSAVGASMTFFKRCTISSVLRDDTSETFAYYNVVKILDVENDFAKPEVRMNNQFLSVK